MRWTPGGRSADLEDRRGASGGGGGFGGFGGGLGIGGTVIVLILSLLFGRNLFTGSSSSSDGRTVASSNGSLAPADSAAEETQVQFVSFVLDDAQKVWEQLTPKYFNEPYRHAKLVLYRGSTSTGCGTGQDAMGPFYCPNDEKVYLDLDFFDEMQKQLNAPGDFAEAYVITHELGHHVQKINGTEARVHQLMDQHPDQQNALSVRLELQADCYAGVWGHTTDQRKILESGDLQEAMNAAAAVGDDRLQKQAGQQVNSDTFTHGTSQQRMTWFRRGFDSGDPRNCDTFAGAI